MIPGISLFLFLARTIYVTRERKVCLGILDVSRSHWGESLL